MKELRTPFKFMVELMFKAKFRRNFFVQSKSLNSEHSV